MLGISSRPMPTPPVFTPALCLCSCIWLLSQLPGPQHPLLDSALQLGHRLCFPLPRREEDISVQQSSHFPSGKLGGPRPAHYSRPQPRNPVNSSLLLFLCNFSQCYSISLGHFPMAPASSSPLSQGLSCSVPGASHCSVQSAYSSLSPPGMQSLLPGLPSESDLVCPVVPFFMDLLGSDWLFLAASLLLAASYAAFLWLY